ncbi:hypothetical protein [Nostoc sp. FACHB-110]|uniref:hypothetical protein n=1 Tax=Nostoc sp. FACHB-110 TaxID=2692834 RepID=UPI0016849F0F|nr:hypothetical protein [Nostoc sp. FACHB-110]MBD2440999.1 hypothetical protein [Nostoc sp. FACHB-110]
MARKSTKATATTATMPEVDTITVVTAAAKLHMATDDFRIKYLKDRYPANYQTISAISEAEFQVISEGIQPALPATKQPQLPAHAENLEIAETPTLQASQTATEKPQNAPIVPQTSQQQLTNPTQPLTPNTGLSLVEQLAKQATEEIAAVDAIAQVKNQLILNNLAIRQTELTEAINQNWQYQKHEYLGAIKDLASLGKQPVEVTPDETDLHQEIDAIIDELGKKLIV